MAFDFVLEYVRGWRGLAEDEALGYLIQRVENGTCAE